CQGILQPARWSDLWETDEQFRLNGMILIGIIPAGIIGLLTENFIDRAFQNPLLVGCMLLVTALILWSSRYARQKPDDRLGVGRSILIGFAQALAIIPGISRSGSTITAGLWLRLHPETAAKFSFFLVIPVILGASALELINALHIHLTSIEYWGVIVGTIAAFLSGWAAILLLMDTLRKGQFSWFALYCAVVGILTIGITMF
ncbi:MAG TPA: undecaprenyl-diphosphate phosphatase, partial [bacterium]|nr:undecaprenyl-diphosphate phosphatase [bacterium]